MKHNFNNFAILKDCLFVDSVRIFENEGYRGPGLDTMSRIEYKEALGDVRILKAVLDKKPELLVHPYGYTFNDIALEWKITHIDSKGNRFGS